MARLVRATQAWCVNEKGRGLDAAPFFVFADVYGWPEVGP
jgi:hypothetical protein